MQKRVKRYNILIAVNLIEKIKEFEHNPPPITGFSIFRLQYLISLILTHKQDNHPDAWSLLNMRYMKNIIYNADQYLNFLRLQGIIEWKNYSAGRNSRLYRLINEGRTDYRTISDRKLIFKIEDNKRKIKLRNSKMYPKLNEYIHKVKIDYKAALKTVESEYHKNINEGNLKAEGRRTFSLAEIEKIHSGPIYIKVNPTNGRLDSNFTRLPSELVPHLTIDDSHLIELDIRNSQPFFAASLFNPTYEILNIMNNFLGHSFTMYIKSLHLSDYKDIKLYTSLVTLGEFYDPFMIEKFKEAKISFKERDDVKEQMFIVFFGKSNAYKYNPAARLFKSIFPNVQILFDAIKKDEHNRLPILLQRIESYVILKRVAPRILSELPELPFITRHDSCLPSKILVCENCVDIAREIMIKTIQEITGLTPIVRIKTEQKYEKIDLNPAYL
jgi:hypothetical protein